MTILKPSIQTSASLKHLFTNIPEAILSAPKRLPAQLKLELESIAGSRLTRHLPEVLHFSAFVNKICHRYPDEICQLIRTGDLTRSYSEFQLYDKICKSVRELSDFSLLDQTIRSIRHVEMVKIAWRELSGMSNIEQSIRDLSRLADGCLQLVLESHQRRLIKIYGHPVGAMTGENAQFVVFALGKLGGHELNFSSDIDLVFAYSETGQTNGKKVISNNEYFIKLGQALINTLNTLTDDGRVYRVDMRLRPNGQSGPPVMSLSAMENYYQIHGREWERYAWIKARPVAGNIELGDQFLKELRPFIYRKYLDYQVYQSLEKMKSMINKEIQQLGMDQNIKLGRGGIREIEFIVQSHQLVRGGCDPGLRTRSLKKALLSLAKSDLINQQIVKKLYQAYLFFRTVEHRLQMQNDQQTHILPTSSENIRFLAASMGLSEQEFTDKLKLYRNFVHGEFARFHSQKTNDATDSEFQLLWSNAVNNHKKELITLHTDKRLVTALSVYAQSKAYRSLEASGRRIMDQLIPEVLQLVTNQSFPLQALNRTLHVISSIGGRTAYLSLLYQFPVVCEQFVQLCASSPWVSQWMADHPIVLDTLINPRTDLYIFNYRDIETLIEARIEDECDVELKHDILRQIHHSCLLQIAIADLQSQYKACEIRGFISNTAQAIVNQVVKLCQLELKEKFGLPAPSSSKDYFGVIAYGKLGSNELSYNADLDLVFIYDDHILCPETKGGKRSVRIDYYFSRLVQRILTMLSMQTSAGKLYDVDTRLRPSGRSGLLVSSLNQYAKYQNEQAWTWEHQALVKARMINLNTDIQSKFNQLRRDVLSKSRQKTKLKKDIVLMRARMSKQENQSDGFNQKATPGGMIDIEFIAQYIVLAHAYEFNELCYCRSVNEILKFSIQHNIVNSKLADILFNAYGELLELENRLKLSGIIDEIAQTKLQNHLDKVQLVWKQMLLD